MTDTPEPSQEPDLLQKAMQAWVQAGTPEDQQRLISAYPELLGADAAARLSQFVELARAQGQEEIASLFERRMEALLTLSRRAPNPLLDANPLAAPLRLLMQSFLGFIFAHTWPDSRRILESNPELLSDVAFGMIENMRDEAEKAGEAERVQRIQEHLDLLRQAREVGIEAAFAGLRFPLFEAIRATGAELSPPLWAGFLALSQFKDWRGAPDIIEAHPVLMSAEAAELLGLAAQAQTSAEARALLEGLRTLLGRSREVGVEIAFREQLGFSDEDLALSEPSQEALLGPMIEFADRPSRDLVERYPVLLRSRAVRMYNGLLASADGMNDTVAANHFRTARDLLLRIYQVGIQKAFEGLENA